MTNLKYNMVSKPINYAIKNKQDSIYNKCLIMLWHKIKKQAKILIYWRRLLLLWERKVLIWMRSAIWILESWRIRSRVLSRNY